MSLSPSPSTPSARPTTTLAQKTELWWQFTVRAVELRHRGSHLGLLWAVLTPVLMLGLYATVFGVIFGGKFNAIPNETHADFALAVFLGLVLFHAVAETMSGSPGFIVANPNFVKKVVFPLEILPLANVTAIWFHASISLALCLAGVAFAGRGLSFSGIAWLPAILLPVVFLSMGLAWLLSAVGVFFRDIVQLMLFTTQVVLYASAVFYPLERIPASVWLFLKWNPLLHSVDLARRALLWDQGVNLSVLAYTWVAGLTMLGIGWVVFKKSQPAFGDVL